MATGETQRLKVTSSDTRTLFVVSMTKSNSQFLLSLNQLEEKNDK